MGVEPPGVTVFVGVYGVPVRVLVGVDVGPVGVVVKPAMQTHVSVGRVGVLTGV